MRYYTSSIPFLQHANSCKSRFQRSVEGCFTRSICRTSNLLRQSSSTARTKHLLPGRPARTRFAPSPTGNLHLGSIRTALFNYLLAKQTKGQFLLRIEDTDQKRTIDGAEEQLRNDLSWAGLLWDEGPVVGGPYGPYRQSERTEIYKDHATNLLKLKHAYRCFCASERLDALNRSRQGKGLPLGYDRKCAHISLEESSDRAHRGEGHVVRLRVRDKYPPWHDFVYGTSGKAGKEARKTLIDDPVYDDPIMVKSDGHPTYHLANVVDDHLMKITHVIRGSEWMSSTPLHLAIYDSFGWDPPFFGHVPLLVDQDNQKLSKRNFDTDISSFRDKQGIFPDALVNFAVLLGWSHQQKSDMLPLRQLEKVFDLKFTKGNTMVSFSKLHFLQQRYAQKYIAERNEHFQNMVTQVCGALRELCDEKHISSTIGDRTLEDVVGLILRADWRAYTTPAAFALRSSNLFKPLSAPGSYKPSSAGSSPSALRVVATSFLLVPGQLWTAAVHRDNIAAIMPPGVMRTGAESGTTADDVKIWRKEVFHFLRWSLMDGASGPPVADLMEILGKDVCTQRINNAIKKTLAQEQAGQLERPNVQTLAASAE